MRLRAGAFSLCFVLLAAASGYAQSPPASPPAAQPPLPGFVPPYEIGRIVRAAGFSPLAPPLREGTTYVLRATDYRGILLRVVVDARSGAIRAINRIVPAYEVGMMTPPYGEPPPYGLPPAYGPPGYRPPGYGPIAAPEMGPEEADLEPSLSPPAPGYALPPPPSLRPASQQTTPPLPRPRPPELAARDVKPADKPSEAPPAKPEIKPAAVIASPPGIAVSPPKKPPSPAIPD